MLEALIFDFDGLIIDTELPEYRSWQEIYAQHGCSLPLTEWSVWVGGSSELFDPYGGLERQIGAPIERDAIRARRRARYAELLEVQPILPGVEEYLVAAKGMGIRLGVASSSPNDWVIEQLSRVGLSPYFDSIKCAGGNVRAKPHPDSYLAVLSELEVRPRNGIALEDSPNGITAAKQANLFCVVVPNPITVQLETGHADFKLDSLAKMSLSQLIEVFERMTSQSES